MKWFLALVLFLFATESFADDWRMRKFDMNMDGFVTKEELIFNGCVVKNGLFKVDEAEKLFDYIFEGKKVIKPCI